MSKAETVKKVFVEISRAILGITFTLSGFAKATDPVGSAYKIQDYLSAFGLDSLYFTALPAAISLCVLEFSIGIFMLTGIYRRLNAWTVLLFMSVMTPLTLYLAIANPVTDCGCFGDALIITNWQTFFKNIVLLAAALTVFIYYRQIQNFYTRKFYWLVAVFTVAFGILYSLANCFFEPAFDFRPYKTGANLPKLITVDEKNADVYENIFIYEKNGVKQEFTEDNYPWEDTAWVFIDRVSRLVKEGEKPIITDFKLNRLYFNSEKTAIESEEDITEEVINDESYVFLMLSCSLSDMRESAISKMGDVKNYASDQGYRFYCLTASTSDEIIGWEKANSANFDFCLTSDRTLKTMMRTNPGLMLLKKGAIINKWSPSEIPAEEELTKPLEELPIGQMPNHAAQNRTTLIWLLSIFIVPLLVIKTLDFLIYRERHLRKKDTSK
ncbi:MAG: DoxX family protein [Prevotella sp.]|jgi:uncharacterized membrane protein YphA (DoxX/SURF4 family)|nr:DoxX family protein [Prevotella sp.]